MSSINSGAQVGMSNVPLQPDGLHILVVEDNVDCAKSTAMLLRHYRHDVEVVLNGTDALEAAKAKRPDVVLLDIGLPRMDGYEVARRLKRLPGAKAPLLIAITGFGQEGDRRQSAEAGIDVHLLKPVEPEYLRRLLERFAVMIHY